MSEVRCITYLVPSIPVELFELIRFYWEEKLKCSSSLLYESRENRILNLGEDPFKENKVDIAWMSSTAYVKLYGSSKEWMELLPVAALLDHNKATQKPQLFTDVILHYDLTDLVKEFSNLRGMRWAYSHDDCLASTAVTLRRLKSEGETASFFGSVQQCGNHKRAIEMVVNKQADAAAVDAHAVRAYCAASLHARKQLKVLESWGPLPPHATVVNKRMPDSLKKQLADLLLCMHEDPVWGSQLEGVGVRKFVPNHHDAYSSFESELRDDVAGHKIKTMYY